MREIERKFFAAITFPFFLIGAPIAWFAHKIERVPVIPWVISIPALLLMLPYMYFSEDSGP